MMKTLQITFLLFTVLQFSFVSVHGKKGDDGNKGNLKQSTFLGLKLRSIGPAFTSGRIGDLAVNPNNPFEYYVAVASGGVWKTTNAGNTYQPIFDSQGSYSIGCVSIDPNNEHIIWVGTGENNNQRSVAYGDGVYKSLDGGKSWKNMGLKKSEHIGKILIDPTNSNTVYVAAMGPLWNKGEERGLYKSTNGGADWNRILHIDEHTGITDIAFDPRNPQVIYAAAQQRRRHVFTYIGGGPGSGIHKSKDGGKTWTKLSSGLPKVDLGRIGLGVSPANPDYVYAIVEAADGKGGFFRSTDRGASWSKMSSYSTSGNYYQEIYCDLTDPNKVFAMDTWLNHTEDGGKTFQKTGEKSKHVDNHAMWIDPNDPNHWLLGSDGGIYETWDHAANWQYKPNLPITQFYKLAVDNTEPFYYVYGGTQDNNTQGGPSRTINNSGIVNADWFITLGGDGFEAAIDPENPNIVYSQAQYGWLARYDKQSGEKVGIKPMPGKGEPGLRWNWDAPLIISPHSHKRLYFAANKLFRSDDRGDTWKAISGDLTRQIDRNKLKVMDKVWSMDAVMKNKSTTIYGNIVALAESPIQEDLLYVGTDDGLIQVSENAGESWRKTDKFPGIPANTYVNDIIASKHDANTVYAVFNNHKKGDFKPYILISRDKGLTWSSVHGNLPKRGSVYAIAEDHLKATLLFAGTEFGLFFSIDGGKEWTQLKNGLPTIAVRDIEIQQRENDLVLATFGRGFYILDDYSPLRTFSKQLLDQPAHIFPIKDGLMYVDARPLGLRGKGSQGESFYNAENPPLGAVFTYLLNDTLKTIKEKRKAKEKKLIEEGKPVPYPSFQLMRDEDQEEKPYILFTITDEKGNEVRKIKSSPKYGMNRAVWDFRYAATTPVRLNQEKVGRYGEGSSGPLALPGKYYVSMHKNVNGVFTELVKATPFECQLLNTATLPAADKEALLDFETKVNELRRVVRASASILNEAKNQLKHMKAAVQQTPGLPNGMMETIKSLEKQMNTLSIQIYGDHSLSKREFETAPAIMDRVETIIWNQWRATAAPTQTNVTSYEIAKEEFNPWYESLKLILDEMDKLEDQLNTGKAPFTPGRLPYWEGN